MVAESKVISNPSVCRINQAEGRARYAHRLSTIRNADQVVVLDDGRVVESGPPGKLLEREGSFAQLSSLQTEAAKVEVDS